MYQDSTIADWTDAELAEMRDEAQAQVDRLDSIFVDVADDPRVVREARRGESSLLCGALDFRFAAYCRGDVAGYLTATPDVCAAARAQACRLAVTRVALLARIRAAAVEIATPSRFIAISALVRRAIANLAGRLHRLPHTCLLAARVSTAQATTVASR